jgi:hypothetical protein
VRMRCSLACRRALLAAVDICLTAEEECWGSVGMGGGLVWMPHPLACGIVPMAGAELCLKQSVRTVCRGDGGLVCVLCWLACGSVTTNSDGCCTARQTRTPCEASREGGTMDAFLMSNVGSASTSLGRKGRGWAQHRAGG